MSGESEAEAAFRAHAEKVQAYADLDGVLPRRTGRGDSPGADLRVLVHPVHVAVLAHAAVLTAVCADHVGAEGVVGGGGDGRSLYHGGIREADRYGWRRLSVGRIIGRGKE